MANSYPAKVNRTVQYRDATGKTRRAVITAVTSPTIATLRIGHSGQTASNVNRRVGTPRPAAGAVWFP